MAETLQEFLDEVNGIRQEIYAKGAAADSKMLASWLDRLLISIEKTIPKLELMAVELAEISEVIDAIQKKEKAAKPAKKAVKRQKAKKKPKRKK